MFVHMGKSVLLLKKSARETLFERWEKELSCRILHPSLLFPTSTKRAEKAETELSSLFLGVFW